MAHVCMVCFDLSETHPERCPAGDNHHSPLCCPGCWCQSFEEAHPVLGDLFAGRLDEFGCVGRRDVGAGRWVAVAPLTLGRARLVLANDHERLDGW